MTWVQAALRHWGRHLLSMLTVGVLWLGLGSGVQAVSERMGVHVLSIGELESVQQFFNATQSANTETEWRYITIPFTLADLDRLDEWQRFFDQAQQYKIIPIVRLATKFENGAWVVPTRRDITRLSQGLSSLRWPTEQRYVIVFNEVNHAKEWGNRIDPAEYAEILTFTSQWLQSEPYDYQVLPAAMDLAAPNGSATKDAFAYFNDMLKANPEVFANIDYWNSHSYPNPGFSSPPYRRAVNSLWGFDYELAFIKDKTGRELKVFITETGWANNAATRRWLSTYYTYALQHIWSDPRVVAVTPFVLKGDPGPFAEFGFIDRNDKPTLQYKALQEAIIKAR